MPHPMKHSFSVRICRAMAAVVLVPVTLGLAACDGTSATASATGNVPLETPSVAQAQSSFQAGQNLARALGRAMGDPSVRETLLAAMRDSRWNENKLVFQAFAATPEGEQVLQAAAMAAGVQPGTLE